MVQKITFSANGTVDVEAPAAPAIAVDRRYPSYVVQVDPAHKNFGGGTLKAYWVADGVATLIPDSTLKAGLVDGDNEELLMVILYIRPSSGFPRLILAGATTPDLVVVVS